MDDGDVLIQYIRNVASGLWQRHDLAAKETDPRRRSIKCLEMMFREDFQ